MSTVVCHTERDLHVERRSAIFLLILHLARVINVSCLDEGTICLMILLLAIMLTLSTVILTTRDVLCALRLAPCAWKSVGKVAKLFRARRSTLRVLKFGLFFRRITRIVCTFRILMLHNKLIKVYDFMCFIQGGPISMRSLLTLARVKVCHGREVMLGRVRLEHVANSVRCGVIFTSRHNVRTQCWTCATCRHFANVLCVQVCASFASDRKVAQSCDSPDFVEKSQSGSTLRRKVHLCSKHSFLPSFKANEVPITVHIV